MSRPVFSTRRLVRRTLILAHRFVFGTLLVLLLGAAAAIYGALQYAKHKLEGGIEFAQVAIHADGLSANWDLSLRADSLHVALPGVDVAGRSLRLRPVLAKNFWAVYPTLKLSVGAVVVDLGGMTESGPAKPPTFPQLRWPMPWRIEIESFILNERGHKQLSAETILLTSRGMLGAMAKATLKPGDWGDSLPALLAAGLKCEVSARWKGESLRYRLSAATVAGDTLKLLGERQKRDLRLSNDSLELSCLRPSLYVPEGLAHDLAPYREFALALHLEATKRISYGGQFRFKVDTLPLLGPIEWSTQWHGGLSRAWMTHQAHHPQGGQITLQAEVPFQRLAPGDTAVSALARLRPLKAAFTASIEGLHLHVGGRRISADANVQEGVWVPGQVATARCITAAGSDMRLAFYLRKAWLLAFEGSVAPLEPWAHAWTDTHVVFSKARAKGQVKAGPVLVQAQATAYGVKAYGAEADSVHAWNTVTRDAYRLDSARIFHAGNLWRGQGGVVWRRKGQFLPGGVEIAFTAQNPALGRGFFRMPHTGLIEAEAERVQADATPYVLLKTWLAAYRPEVTGRFAWDLVRQSGSVDARVKGAAAGYPVEAAVQADWDHQGLHLAGLDVQGEGLDMKASARVWLHGKPFYDVYQARFHDIAALSLQIGGVDAAAWVSRWVPHSPWISGGLQGDFAFTPESGLRGSLHLDHLRLKGQPAGMEFGTLHLQGQGDTLSLSVTTQSKLEPFFNSRVLIRALKPLSLQPDFLVDATLRDSLHLAARASVEASGHMRGAIDLVGAVELPAGVGSLSQVHWLTAFEWPLKEGIAGLRADSRALQGVFKPQGWPQQTFAGRLRAEAGVVSLDSMRLVDPEGKVLQADATYVLAPKPALQFKVRGDAFALSWKNQPVLRLRDLKVAGGLNTGGFQVAADVSSAQFEYKQGAVLAMGRVEGLAAEYRLPAALPGGSVEPTQVKLRGTLAQSLLRHKIGPSELSGFFRSLLRWTKTQPKPSPATANGQGNGGAAGRARPMELTLQVDTKGQDNRIETEVGRLNFAGDIGARGVYPYLLLNGAVTSLKGGEIGQKSQAYELRDLELKWQNSPPQEGTLSLEGDKKLKIDCDPQTQKTCHVTIRFDGRFDEAKFSYETDCGGEEGEAIKPTAIINSVARGCYSGDLSGGDNQGDYGKTFVNLITPIVNENLTRVINKGSAGWIKNANVTGLSQWIEGENAQMENDEPVALNLESKEKYRMRLLGRGGYFPASKQSSTYDLKVVAEWRPPVDRWVSDSAWKDRLKDRITVDAGIESRPEERSADVERQVRRQVGVKYKYQFWKFW